MKVPVSVEVTSRRHSKIEIVSESRVCTISSQLGYQKPLDDNKGSKKKTTARDSFMPLKIMVFLIGRNYPHRTFSAFSVRFCR